jgi:succinyl-diaminopimelate desuccinylase
MTSPLPEADIRSVLEAVDADALNRLAVALVRLNTVWDPVAGTSEQPAADLVADWARREGFDVAVDEVAPGRPNVVVRHAGRGGRRTLMFEGHTDVVTPGDRSNWKMDPFGGQIVAGRLYGRGSNDTKGNLAAMLIAMAAVKRSGVPISGQLIGGVLCDEEDLMLGVQDFIRRGHADDVTAAIICEPQDGLICLRQKGALRAEVRIDGRMSHGAMPLTGLNTAPAVARLIDGLHGLERQAADNPGRDPLLGWPSFTPTVIQAPSVGPAQLNVMPQQARILVDVRTVPGQSHPELRRQMDRLARQVTDAANAHYREHDARLGINRPHRISVAVEVLTDRPCTATDPNDPIAEAAEWAARRVTGRAPEHGGVPGATDGTYLWALKQIPIVTMGAGDRGVPHQVDEWVDLAQLLEHARIYALSALHYLYPQEAP